MFEIDVTLKPENYTWPILSAEFVVVRHKLDFNFYHKNTKANTDTYKKTNFGTYIKTNRNTNIMTDIIQTLRQIMKLSEQQNSRNCSTFSS